MAKSVKAKPPSFAQLTRKVVQTSPRPIPFEEIYRRVNAKRVIDTRSPKNTIRNAVTQCRLIAPDGQGRYGWSPRMMRGARVRVDLVARDLKRRPRQIEFDDDARELLWPSFFDLGSKRDLNPVTVMLPDGGEIQLPLNFLGKRHWGTLGTPEFWAWLRTVRARAGDALIFEADDAHVRHYRLEHVPAAKLDQDAIGTRTNEIIIDSMDLMRSSRARSISAVWDLARLLLVMGRYTHPTPPRPISEIWPLILRRLDNPAVITGEIYQLKITLEDTRPAIWRRVLVPGTWNLGALHYVVQVAMGWTNSHLHQFIVDDDNQRTSYRLLQPGEDEGDDGGKTKTRDSSRVKLSTVLPNDQSDCYYMYDFGDSWLHHIDVERIDQASPNAVYPWCIGGECACPPEDCGGTPGYEDLLKILRNPKHPDYEQMQEWLEHIDREEFDPERFDHDVVNQRLGWINPKQLGWERNVRLFLHRY